MNDKYNYRTIHTTVKDEILAGVYPPGTLLPTESNLAEKYGVSRPTISKVYNQLQKEGYVNKKKGTGTLVLFNGSQAKVYTFGLLLPGSGESEIFSVINDQILKQSKKMHFYCLWEGATASNADIRRNLIETCCDNYIAKGVDGIFFSPLERVPDADEINRSICDKIRQAGIPLILIDRDIVPIPQKSPFDVIGIDNYNAGCHMATHLMDAGCSDIHFLFRPHSAYSVRIRSLGVKDTVQEAGLVFDENHLHCADPGDLDYIKKISVVKGKTGIICANDSTAAVLMSSLETIGYTISRDLLICGYDNMKYSQHLKHSLTSFTQPCIEIANSSIDLMMMRIGSEERSPVSVYMNGQIVVRESTKFKK
jgi:DNA-binding LacI/PurR family transcriptional regulator